MKSKQIVLTVMATASIAALFTAFAFQALGDNSVAHAIPSNPPVVNTPVDLSSVQNRLQQLEQQLEEERNARQALEVMLGHTSGSKDKPSMAAMIETMQQEAINSAEVSLTNGEAEMAAFRTQQRAEMLKQMQPEFKIQQLVNSGFNKDEASWIVNSETEAQLEQLRAQYDARRKALSDPNAQNNLGAYRGDQLRKKLGDDYYERYLKAKGMPTSVSVGSVMANSPGENAGLLPGDEIVAYNNKRVFSAYGLNRMTATGKEGENVLIEVERNGESVQLTIPRGPIGVQSNRY